MGVLLFKNINSPGALDLFYFSHEENVFNSTVLKKHGLAVVKMIGFVVAGLHDLDSIVPTLQALGKRHVKRGILPEHYPVIGQALLDALEACLGAGYNQDVKAAWVAVYQIIIADTMMSDNYTNLEA